MPAIYPLHRGRALAGVASWVVGALAAVSLLAQPAPATDPLDGLVRDSPFMPAAGAAAGPGAEAGPLEFRGMVYEGGTYSFSIYDQGSKESTWVQVGEKGLPFVVRSFDREKESLVVEQQGRSLTLTLQSPKIAAAAPVVPSGGPNALPGPGEMGPRPGGLPIPAQSSGAPIPQMAPSQGSEEAMRLQKIADEIRRRRNLSNPANTPKKP